MSQFIWALSLLASQTWREWYEVNSKKSLLAWGGADWFPRKKFLDRCSWSLPGFYRQKFWGGTDWFLFDRNPVNYPSFIPNTPMMSALNWPSNSTQKAWNIWDSFWPLLSVQWTIFAETHQYFWPLPRVQCFLIAETHQHQSFMDGYRTCDV